MSPLRRIRIDMILMILDDFLVAVLKHSHSDIKSKFAQYSLLIHQYPFYRRSSYYRQSSCRTRVDARMLTCLIRCTLIARWPLVIRHKLLIYRHVCTCFSISISGSLFADEGFIIARHLHFLCCPGVLLICVFARCRFRGRVRPYYSMAREIVYSVLGRSVERRTQSW